MIAQLSVLKPLRKESLQIFLIFFYFIGFNSSHCVSLCWVCMRPVSTPATQSPPEKILTSIFARCWTHNAAIPCRTGRVGQEGGRRKKKSSNPVFSLSHFTPLTGLFILSDNKVSKFKSPSRVSISSTSCPTQSASSLNNRTAPDGVLTLRRRTRTQMHLVYMKG